MSLTRYRRAVTESDMQRTITEAVTAINGRLWHVRDSRGQGVDDLPDLLIACPPTFALFELKSRRNPTIGQQQAIALIGECDRLVSGIVRPVPRPGEWSLDEALEILTGEPR